MCPSIGTNTGYLRFGDISTVALLVGKKKTAFHVHVDLLCESSSFFKAAFTSPWKENTERKMKLADDDAATFELFVQWLYTQQYEITTEKKQGIARMLEPVRLYVLAEKYDIVKLKNKICRKLYEGRTVHGFGPCKNTVECAYDNLPQSSPMRRMLVDWYTWHVTCRWFEYEENQKWLPRVPEFAADLAVALSKKSRSSTGESPLELGVANYYEEERKSRVR